jgi:hypothetical protein
VDVSVNQKQKASSDDHSFKLDEPILRCEGDRKTLADTMKVYTRSMARLPATKKAGANPALWDDRFSVKTSDVRTRIEA